MFSRTCIYFKEILSPSPQLFMFRANCTGRYSWKSFYQLRSFISGLKLPDPTVEVSYFHRSRSMRLELIKIFRMYRACTMKCGAAILLHASLFTINNLRIARLFISFFFRISDCRYLRIEYRSVIIDQSKDGC